MRIYVCFDAELRHAGAVTVWEAPVHIELSAKEFS